MIGDGLSRRLSCVLLVDDSPADLFLHRLVLEEEGCAEVIHEATNGARALEWLRAAHAGEYPVPELVFLDINMPVLDGWGFLEKATSENLVGEGTVVVAMLSTSSAPRDRARATSIPSVVDHLAKPLTVEALRRVLDGLPS